MAIVTLALAGDPTCPSDLNSDGTVATADLLELLGDWGPCPGGPRIINITASGGGTIDRLSRLWSDGLIEVNTNIANSGWSGWVVIPG